MDAAGTTPEEWQFVPPEAMALRDYPCGLRAGQVLRLRKELAYEACNGKPTGKKRRIGDEAMVMTGNPAEPEVVWFRWWNARHSATWDGTVHDWFDVLEPADRNPALDWWWQAGAWWKSRRRLYNIGLALAGLGAFAAYALVLKYGVKTSPGQEPPEITLFTLAAQAVGYVLMMGVANKCYGLGAWVERFFGARQVVRYRSLAFWGGFWFSVALPFVIPLLAWLANSTLVSNTSLTTPP